MDSYRSNQENGSSFPCGMVSKKLMLLPWLLLLVLLLLLLLVISLVFSLMACRLLCRYVIPVEDLLQMTQLIPHETLLDKGKLVEHLVRACPS